MKNDKTNKNGAKNDRVCLEIEIREVECDNGTQDGKKEADWETKIYNALNTAEVISVKLAQINQLLKKAKKKRKKKAKKLGKVDKKTGTLILKGQKKQKAAKVQKRYKPPKSK
jgi:hypothetical protein